MTMTKRTPTSPPGVYPHELLYPHVGSTPNKASISNRIKIVPRLITQPLFANFFGLYALLAKACSRAPNCTWFKIKDGRAPSMGFCTQNITRFHLHGANTPSS
jgi:hypothetical protein